MNGIESLMCRSRSVLQSPKMSRSSSKIILIPILLHFLQLRSSWFTILTYNAGVIEIVCPVLSLTKCDFIHEWLAYMAVQLSAMSVMTFFSTTSVVFARDPVIAWVMDAQQSVHKYPLSSSIWMGLPDGLAIRAFCDGPRSTLCRPLCTYKTSMVSISPPSSMIDPFLAAL